MTKNEKILAQLVIRRFPPNSTNQGINISKYVNTVLSNWLAKERIEEDWKNLKQKTQSPDDEFDPYIESRFF
jgi:hypothetical protein